MKRRHSARIRSIMEGWCYIEQVDDHNWPDSSFMSQSIDGIMVEWP